MTNAEDLIHSFAGNDEYGDNSNGLTKREHFASMALQGLASNPANTHADPESLANQAVELAAYLIDILNEGN